jgi:hypothetical protein
MIDFINNYRTKEDSIKYVDFDKSFNHCIWDYSGLTLKEKQYRNIYKKELIKLIEILPLVKQSINELVLLGDEIYLLSSRDIELKEDIILFLQMNGINIERSRVYLGLNSNEKIDKIEELELDFYIDDDPELLSKAKKKDIMIVVKDNFYNKNHQNLIRLECFSQLTNIKRRIKNKFKKSKLKG